MTNIPTPFETAIAHHQAGRLAQAERLYRKILADDPRDARAAQLLGVLAHQCGKQDVAIRLISEAIRLDPAQADFHLNLGEAYRASGKLEEAKACYERALELEPRLAPAYANLAMAHTAQGQWQAAEQCCRQALALRGETWDLVNLLGDVLERSGNTAQALACFQRAVAIQPDAFDALVNLGIAQRRRRAFAEATAALERALAARPDSAGVRTHLGDVQSDQGHWQAAADWYRQALLRAPDDPAAEARLGTALQALGHVEEALPYYRRALKRNPRGVTGRYNFGTALGLLRQYDEAAEQYKVVLEIVPDHLGALTNLAGHYKELGDYAQALPYYDHAIRRWPDAPEPRYGRALVRLSQGDLTGGWEDYESRIKLQESPVRAIPGPQWDGSAMPNGTLVVHAEQGLGDTLQFIRYLPWVRERSGKIVLQVQTPLVPLLRAAGFAEAVGRRDELPPYDAQVPLLSLPRLAGTDRSNIPAPVPYLSADPAAVRAWSERLNQDEAFRVGVVWKGSSKHLANHTRSIPLAAFEPLVRVAGVQLISLQKHDGLDELSGGPFDIFQLPGAWDEAAGAFVDTAAVMKNLDLVIAADTAPAHLAGAMGVDVWLALSAQPDWRWTTTGEATPWYPTMRLFRQTTPGDWNGVFARIAVDLEQHVTRRQPKQR